MKKQSLMDYDDQMVYALTMLKVSPQILEYFQEMYKYICVDEAQDTSKIQHQIIALLASKYKKVFMVETEDKVFMGLGQPTLRHFFHLKKIIRTQMYC